METVLVQSAQEVADAYRITATPSAVVVTADGMVASAVAQGAGAIERLLDGIVRAPVLRLTPPPGTAVAADAGRA